MMPRRDAVAHTPRGGEKLAFAVLGANGLSTLALLALAIKQSRPYAPDAQTAAFAHLNRIAAWAARWISPVRSSPRSAAKRRPAV